MKSLKETLQSGLRDGRIIGLEASRVSYFREIFHQQDLRARELIGLSFENGADCIAAYLAAAECDLIVSPLPPSIPESERLTLWRRLPIRFYLDSTGLHSLLSRPAFCGWPEDIHWVMHSSGSTGLPKPIALTWAAVKQNSQDVACHLKLKAGERHLGSMSQCYTNGLYNSFLLPLALDSFSIIHPLASALRSKEYLKLIDDHRPEILWLNPTVVKILMRSSGPKPFQNSRYLISCTAPLTAVEAREAEKIFQKPVLQSYGLTETLIVSIERTERNVESEFSAGAILGGVSKVRFEESILHIENGAVTPGYISFCNEALEFSFDADSVSRKRFVSSDLGRLNAKGDLEITGRVSNMINVDGVKVSSEQIESFFNSQPGVQMAAVARLSLEDGRERPVVFIQRDPNRGVNSAQILDACAKSLGSKARPHKIFELESLPLNASGKIDRTALEKKLLQLIAVENQPS